MNQDYIVDITKKFKKIWDVTEHYWYPLSSCNRKDIIVFDRDYCELHGKFDELISCLIEHSISEIIELREDGSIKIIKKINGFEFWMSDEYFWMNEGFWFDNNFDWVIYKSHEDTVTIGGNWLMSQMMIKWND